MKQNFKQYLLFFKLTNLALGILLVLSACQPAVKTPDGILPDGVLSTTQANVITATTTNVPPTTTPTPLPIPTKAPRVLSICLGQEPKSLFLYGDLSGAAESVLQAVYDGPFDIRNYAVEPVILQSIPSLSNGEARLQQVEVKPGELLVDNQGKWVNLTEGVKYRPSACTEITCTQTYAGSDPIKMDQLVVDFKLLPNIKWSDGSSLTADDSLYSFEVARALYPAYRPDLLNLTQSYKAIDQTTIEWTGLPGYLGGEYSAKFFTPLPRHAWGNIPPADLPAQQQVYQQPLGWGAYSIDEWVLGDHISLHKNPYYFRQAQGLPNFDQLVFRFVTPGKDTTDALLTGECDVADETSLAQADSARLLEAQKAGKLALTVQKNVSWEQAVFNINPTDSKQPAFFAQKAVRQAVALCIDRQALAGSQPLAGSISGSNTADVYLASDNPLFNKEAKQYGFDPGKGAELLTQAGWVDEDNDPGTPRKAVGVPGILDGTRFQFTYLTSQDEQHQQDAQAIAQSLARCGIQATVESMPLNELLASGPEGPVFGRHFDMAQFGWVTSLTPSCSLYQSDEIPGPYPEFPNGWGGANAGGYASAAFDQACQAAMTWLPDSQQYHDAQFQAQAIFAEDLPVLPLYLQSQAVASRPDFCGWQVDSSNRNALWNIEAFNYAEGCK